MMKLAVAGCAGRMGKALVGAIASSNDLVLTAATISPKSALFEKDVGSIAGIAPLDLYPAPNFSKCVEDFEMLIDFTKPIVTLSNLDLCVKQSKKMIIGTTGFDASQLEKIKEAAKIIPIVFAPNMSVGLNVCIMLIQEAAARIGKESDIYITDAHHRHKKDSPSGTSLQIEEALRDVVSNQPIEHTCIRAGDLIGDHTVLFGLEGETIEVKHHAVNRTIFANGALRAARWLQNKPAGLYTMRDVLA